MNESRKQKLYAYFMIGYAAIGLTFSTYMYFSGKNNNNSGIDNKKQEFIIDSAKTKTIDSTYFSKSMNKN